MTAYTSSANGEWNSDATWGGAGHPVAGDTATIGHNVYIDSNVTMGTSPTDASTYVITINSGGVLRWANPPSGNYTFECRGNIRVKDGGSLQIGTSSVAFDASYTADLYFPMTTAGWYWRIYNNGGSVEFSGASAYHMASASMQRAKLNAAFSHVDATPVTFTLDRDVDWSVGDWIVMGHGGQAATAMNPTTYQSERVQIASKISASSYTAIFVYDHQAGDFVFNVERNVMIRGYDNTKGIRIETDRGTGDGSTTKTYLNWMKIRYGGQSTDKSYAAVYHNISPTNKNYEVADGNFYVGNSVFDENGSRSGAVSSAYAIAIATTVPLANPDCIANVHVYDYGTAFKGDTTYLYPINISNLTAVRVCVKAIESYYAQVDVDGYWYNNHDWTYSASYAIYGNVNRLSNFEWNSAYYGYYTAVGSVGANMVPLLEMDTGHVYHAYQYGVYFSLANSMKIKSVAFRECRVNGVIAPSSTAPSTLRITGCSFDACGINTLSHGAVRAQGDTYIDNCTFGTNSRNGVNNVLVAITAYNLFSRCVALNSTFIEPLNYTTNPISSYPYYKLATLWSVYPDQYYDYRARLQVSNSSIELKNCTVRTSGGVDRWALDYPNATEVLITNGGGELLNGPAPSGGWLDNSFKRTLLPFHGAQEFWVNAHFPITIPVLSGQDVSVKLSMRKHKDGAYCLPGIRLEGPGIRSVAHMTAALLDTWEELTVSGTASASGMCKFFVSGGSNTPGQGNAGFMGDLTYTPTDVYTGSSNSDVVFFCYVYADQLKIQVTGP